MVDGRHAREHAGFCRVVPSTSRAPARGSTTAVRRSATVVAADLTASRTGPGEACDDGDAFDDDNAFDDDTCSNTCKLATCGDGLKQGPEPCDLGDLNSSTGECLLACVLPVCGDGFTPPRGRHGRAVMTIE